MTVQFSSDGEQWEEEGQRFPTPTNSEFEAWRAEGQNVGDNGQASNANSAYNDRDFYDSTTTEEGDSLDEAGDQGGDYENNGAQGDYEPIVFPLRRSRVVENLNEVPVHRSLLASRTIDTLPASRRTSCMQPCPCHPCCLARQVLRGRTTDEYTDSEAEHMERRFSYFRDQLFPLSSDSEDTSGSETSDSDH